MRIVIVGEGMIELSRSDAGWLLGYGGDTLNTAIHLARLGSHAVYVTALGTDPFSQEMCDAWAAEGVDTGLILTDADRHPGLYAIRTDALGERSFTYWREGSAARRLFDLPGIDAVLAAAATADILYYSLISLAILGPEGRSALFALSDSVRRRGGRVAFDGNYRPRLWASLDEARAVHATALARADIGLPTVEDETLLLGTSDAFSVAAHWRAAGVAETVVKMGARGCLIDGGVEVAPPHVLVPIDTSGAGDAFNAGYLHARLGGADGPTAALAGHELAGWVVARRGAVPDHTADAPYP